MIVYNTFNHIYIWMYRYAQVGNIDYSTYSIQHSNNPGQVIFASNYLWFIFAHERQQRTAAVTAYYSVRCARQKEALPNLMYKINRAHEHFGWRGGSVTLWCSECGDGVWRRIGYTGCCLYLAFCQTFYVIPNRISKFVCSRIYIYIRFVAEVHIYVNII